MKLTFLQSGKKNWTKLQGGLWVSGRRWCDFASFHPNFKEKQLFIVKVERDEKFIAELAKLAQKTITMRDEILIRIKEE